jgi:8-oxo-dGTP pyrophosphatase MutT (NUDIX family)
MFNKADTLEVIDESGKVIGIENFSEANKKGLLHRFCRVLVINSSDMVILHKRSKYVSDAGRLDSAGGHLDVGENYQIAVLRELEEEMGIKVPESETICLGHIEDRTRPEKENMIGEVFMVRHNGPYIAEENEVSNFIEVPLTDFVDTEKLAKYGHPSPKLISCVDAYKKWISVNNG